MDQDGRNIGKGERVMRTKEEIISDFAQTVFIVFGGLCLFFSGHVLRESFLLSGILLMIGLLSLLIKVEYKKEMVNNE